MRCRSSGRTATILRTGTRSVPRNWVRRRKGSDSGRDAAAARRAPACSAPVTVIACDDAAIVQGGQMGGRDVTDMAKRRVADRHIEHLVEVTIVQRSIPADG